MKQNKMINKRKKNITQLIRTVLKSNHKNHQSVNFFKTGYTSIYCSQIEHMSYNLILQQNLMSLITILSWD